MYRSHRPKNTTPLPGLCPAAVALRAASIHAGRWFPRLSRMSIDEFSLRYSDLVTGSYDCVDRIVLNAFFPLGYNPGGFRVWWRRWHDDSDAELDNTHLMRLAGRFARRVKAWGAANGVPVIFCTAGERKHRIAEAYLATHEVGIGVFLVLVAKAPAPVWKVVRSSKTDTIVNIERRREYVNHYSFHIIDPEWGHVTIKMSGHPPFGAQIILNGHEFVARQAGAAGIAFGKAGNCFTAVADPAGLARIADALSQHIPQAAKVRCLHAIRRPGAIARRGESAVRFERASLFGRRAASLSALDEPVEDPLACTRSTRGVKRQRAMRDRRSPTCRSRLVHRSARC